MSLQEKFAAAALSGEESFAAVCRVYGISRKTGYKWLERAQNGEPLTDRSRAPHVVGNRTAPEVEALILACRAEYPAWGPRKLERYLLNRGYKGLPSKSTMANILLRGGCIEPGESKKHTACKRFERSKPNSLWQIDYKGEFRMLNGELCYPLTILDNCCRYKPSPGVDWLVRKLGAGYHPHGDEAGKKRAAAELQLHSDQGFQYTSQAYFELTKEYGITPSMSRRGNCYDNAVAENFFSILKTECIYRQKIESFQQTRELIDDFIFFYNHERIQLKTGVAPLSLRHSA